MLEELQAMISLFSHFRGVYRDRNSLSLSFFRLMVDKEMMKRNETLLGYVTELKESWQSHFIWKIVFQTLTYCVNQEQENNAFA